MTAWFRCFLVSSLRCVAVSSFRRSLRRCVVVLSFLVRCFIVLQFRRCSVPRSSLRCFAFSLFRRSLCRCVVVLLFLRSPLCFFAVSSFVVSLRRRVVVP